jgi:hypothetical protein
LVIFAGLFAIFFLPYHFPVPGPTGSQSWEFGYSNTAAQGFIALMLLGLLACRMFFNPDRSVPVDIRRVFGSEDADPSMRPMLYTMGIIQVVMALILVFWFGILPYTHYGEFTYFIQRVEAVILGGVPYKDFAFDYGPGMLAVPVAIYRLSQGRLSVETAYLITLVLHFVVGFALLAYVVSRVGIKQGRSLIFALLAIPFVNLTMGLNYTPLRFTVAIASVFFVRDIYLFTGDNSRLRLLLLSLAGLFLPVLVFAVSPEMGLALTFALVAYFAWFILGPERGLAVLILPVIAGVGISVWLFPPAYFSSIMSFGKGGGSFPLFPTIHIVAFLAAAIWLFPRLGVTAIRDRTGIGPFAAGLAILFGLLILPAMGRCDSGHVYFNSLGLFVFALGAASWVPNKFRYALLGVFFVIYPLVDQVTFWDHYQQPIQSALAIRRQLSGYDYQPDNFKALGPGMPKPPIHYSKLLPTAPWVEELPKEKIGIPLGADEPIERYLVLTGRSVSEYHIAPFGDIFEPAQLDRKFADLKKMNYILIPEYYLNYLRANPAAQARAQADADCKFMSGLLLFPISLPPVHLLFQPEFDIMHQIYNDYGLVKEYPGCLLLRRK